MKSSPLHHRIHKHVVHHVHRVHKHVSHHTTHLLSSIRKAQLYRWYRAHLPAFTLTDTLVATGIFLILTSTVLVAINPLKMFVDSRNNKRIRELKVVRDSLVQYTTDNTAGATNILGVSIPPCTESPGTEIGTGEGKVDLSNLSGFIPTYLASVPIDPKIGTAASTGYRVCRKSDLDYCVTAMYPESAGGSTVTMGCDYSIITPSPTPPGTPTSTPTPTAAPVTSGLVLSHQMSAGTGTTSLDETTNANNGTLTNGPTWTTGYLGLAISFDGTNDYISVPHSSTLALTGDMTITAWVNPTDRSNYFGIIGKTSGNTAAPYDFYLTGTTGIPRLLRGNGSDSASVDATAAPATGQWSHVAVVMSGTTVTHYLNGVANGSGTLSTTIADTGGALRIGSRADDVTMFKGVMDDVRIYNRALNADEISRIKAPAPTPTATPTITLTPTLTPVPVLVSGSLTIQGRTNKSGASVIFTGTPGTYSTTTDSNGNYSLNMPTGTYTVTADINLYLSRSKPMTISGPTTMTAPDYLRGGDADGDGTVNSLDGDIIGANFNLTCASPGFDARSDINGDCTVNIFDLVLYGGNSGLVEPMTWLDTPTPTLTPTNTPTVTLTPTPTLTPTAAPAPTNTLTPTPTSGGRPVAPP